MNIKRGDTILVNYPFASGTGSKVRPALVVQADRNNSRLENSVIVQITSRIQHAHSEPTQLLIRMNSPEGKQAGLIMDSVVSCKKTSSPFDKTRSCGRSARLLRA